MDVQFTPWRKNYMQGERSPGCFFCTAAQAPADRLRELLVLHRTPDYLVVLNRYPYNTGHLLLAPVAHAARPSETPPELAATLGLVQRALTEILFESYQPHGLNAGINLGQAAGAGVADHYHWHVLPRWSGDSNFMGVVAQTRLISETLEETLDRLAPLVVAHPEFRGG